MITLVAGMIVLLNCSLFLVFHVWDSIVVVSVRVSFFVFGGRDKDDIVRMSNICKDCKDELYSLFCHIICNLEI